LGTRSTEPGYQEPRESRIEIRIENSRRIYNAILVNCVNKRCVEKAYTGY